MKVKKKKEFSYILKGVDPNTVWDLVGELGDGSFGKVYKVCCTNFITKFRESSLVYLYKLLVNIFCIIHTIDGVIMTLYIITLLYGDFL